MTDIFTLVPVEKGIKKLVFDLPNEKVNKLTTKVMSDLNSWVKKLSTDTEIKVLLVESAKKNIFIAGADINEISGITKPEEGFEKARSGQAILDAFEQLPFPTVAVIDGACVGGGLEFALACTFRVATDNPKTSIGLVEVNLGIIPGFGGTQRLPRLIGIQEAVPLIVGGKTLNGKKALKKNIVDACVPAEWVGEKSLAFARRLLVHGVKKDLLKKRSKRTIQQLLMEKTPIGRMLFFYLAKKQILKQSKGHYPAPLVALQTIKRSCTKSLKNGLIIEAKGFSSLVWTPICKNLVSLYFISESFKKDTASAEGVIPKEIQSTGVLGAGVMGGGIAWLMSSQNLPVRMKDLNWQALAKGYESATSIYLQLLKKKILTGREVNLKLHQITAATDYSGLKNADIVIEAVVEDMAIKKKVLQDLENNVSDTTIIATNTSALSIEEIASVLKHPERFIGMHFFNPVNRMPLVEVIPGPKTSAETIATLVAFTKTLKKTPIVVQNCPGFVVNRLLLPYMNEALFMFEEGNDWQRIDKLIYKFGMPMGPFTLADEVGIDVGYKVGKVLAEGYGGRMAVSESIRKIYELGLLGKKSKKGFFIYQPNGKKMPNPDINNLRAMAKLSASNDQTIIDRCMFIMINEAARCLEENIVASAEQLDMAMIMGTGLPPFRGGLLRYADSLGIKNVVERFSQLQKEVGTRFAPCQLLVDMAANNKTFYKGV